MCKTMTTKAKADHVLNGGVVIISVDVMNVDGLLRVGRGADNTRRIVAFPDLNARFAVMISDMAQTLSAIRLSLIRCSALSLFPFIVLLVALDNLLSMFSAIAIRRRLKRFVTFSAQARPAALGSLFSHLLAEMLQMLGTVKLSKESFFTAYHAITFVSPESYANGVDMQSHSSRCFRSAFRFQVTRQDSLLIGFNSLWHKPNYIRRLVGLSTCT